MGKTRVLHIKGTLSSDGATVIEYNFAQQLNKSVVFDWLLDAKAEKGWKEKYSALGSKVYHIKYKRTRGKVFNAIRKYKAYKRFFKRHKYNTIHIDTDGFHRVVELFAAKRAGVPQRIVHSHNTTAEVNGLLSKRKSLIRVGQWLYLHLATDYVACSEDAGNWLFGEKNKNKTICLKNGIDIQKYKFDPEKRERVRAQLGVDGCTVYGHVGRFEAQKNHKFLISVFKSIYENNKDSRLLLIGDGSLKNEVEKIVQTEQLEQAVIFLGNVDNVDHYYNAMDLFLFPSAFEGLGIVAIEAQCNGLPVIMSEGIPKLAKITQECVYLPVEKGADVWAQTAEKAAAYDPKERESKYKQIESAQFDIQTSAKKLSEIYLKKGE